jgi:predicted membrane metal-binding protein
LRRRRRLLRLLRGAAADFTAAVTLHLLCAKRQCLLYAKLLCLLYAMLLCLLHAVLSLLYAMLSLLCMLRGYRRRARLEDW